MSDREKLLARIAERIIRTDDWLDADLGGSNIRIDGWIEGFTEEEMALIREMRAEFMAAPVSEEQAVSELERLEATLERVTGMLWDATKPDEMPLWWCLNAERKEWFRENLAAPESEGES